VTLLQQAVVDEAEDAGSLRLIPPVAFVERWTPGPVEIGGVAIGSGEFIGASVLAANRDRAVCCDPLRYVRRANAALRLVACEEPAGFAFRRPATLHAR